LEAGWGGEAMRWEDAGAAAAARGATTLPAPLSARPGDPPPRALLGFKEEGKAGRRGVHVRRPCREGAGHGRRQQLRVPAGAYAAQCRTAAPTSQLRASSATAAAAAPRLQASGRPSARPPSHLRVAVERPRRRREGLLQHAAALQHSGADRRGPGVGVRLGRRRKGRGQRHGAGRRAGAATACGARASRVQRARATSAAVRVARALLARRGGAARPAAAALASPAATAGPIRTRGGAGLEAGRRDAVAPCARSAQCVPRAAPVPPLQHA
jgi:hypothetical protein